MTSNFICQCGQQGTYMASTDQRAGLNELYTNYVNLMPESAETRTKDKIDWKGKKGESVQATIAWQALPHLNP